MANYDELEAFIKRLTDRQLNLLHDVARREKWARKRPSGKESEEAKKTVSKWLVQQKLDGRDIDQYCIRVSEYFEDCSELHIPLSLLLVGGTELQEYVDMEPREATDHDVYVIERVATPRYNRDMPDDIAEAITKIDLNSVADYWGEE